MSKARVLAQYSRYLRSIAVIERIELPAVRRRLARTKRSLAELQRLTQLNDALVDRLRHDVDEQLARRH